MATHQTDFRANRRGRPPSDWTERWKTGTLSRIEGAACDLSHRSVLRMQGLSGEPFTRTALSWNAPDGDTGRANQQILIRFRIVSRATDSLPFLVLRGGGNAGTEDGYTVHFEFSGARLRIFKYVAGVATALGSSGTQTFVHGAFYYLRFEATSTTIRTRFWEDGDAEPGGYHVTVTDTSLTDGWMGAFAGDDDDVVEINYFSAGTNGDVAPAESTIPTPLDQWCLLPDEEIELTAEIETYDPATDTVGTTWASTRGRSTGPTDYPSSVSMEPWLEDPGTHGATLSADAQLGGAALPPQAQLVLGNRPSTTGGAGPLDFLTSRSLAGRPVILRAGRRWLTRPSPTSDGVKMPHRHFEILRPAVAAQEPSVGETVTIPLAHPAKVLGQTVAVRRNVGIPVGVECLSSSGYLSIPTSTSYERTAFRIYARILVPTAGVAGSNVSIISRRETDATHRQWFVTVGQNSHANANKIIVQSWDAGGVQIIGFATSAKYNLGRFVDVVLGLRGGDRWYLLVDGAKVGGGALSSNPTTAAGAAVHVLINSAINCIVCDHRIELYGTEDESLARFAARAAPDAVTLSMHRCDDESGNTVTDYATLANHGTLQGTDGVDRRRAQTYLGSLETAGTPQPLLEGVVWHAPTQAINPATELFRFNDRVHTAGTDVGAKAKGLALSNPASFGIPSPGVIDVVGASDQPITCALDEDLTPGAHRSTQVPQLIQEVLTARGAVSAATADLDSFLAARTLWPMVGGVYYSDPPTVEALIAQLSTMGGHYRLDGSGRVAVGAMMPPLNPGPWGKQNFLELMGYPSRGVTLSPHSSYSLTQTAGCSVVAIFKVQAPPDASTSSSFTYFPAGQTVVDGTGGSATGYYLGIDGRDGRVIFGMPGVTGNGTGLHYIKAPLELASGRWYAAVGLRTSLPGRSITVYELKPDSGGLVVQSDGATEATTGAMAANTGQPIRIGHGLGGPFHGAIFNVIGSSAAKTVIVDGTGKLAQYGPGEGAGTDRWSLLLSDGEGDTALETVQSRLARIEGARWCPRLTIDFDRAAEPQLDGMRAAMPAWRVVARHRHNYQPLTGADVAAGVSAAGRVDLGKEWLEQPGADAGILADYPLAHDLALGTPLYSAADAAWVGARMRERLSTGRQLADPKGWRREALRLQLTDEVKVKHARWAPGGKSMRVYSLLHRLAQLRTDLGAWG